MIYPFPLSVSDSFVDSIQRLSPQNESIVMCAFRQYMELPLRLAPVRGTPHYDPAVYPSPGTLRPSRRVPTAQQSCTDQTAFPFAMPYSALTSCLAVSVVILLQQLLESWMAAQRIPPGMDAEIRTGYPGRNGQKVLDLI